jgi:16S rRNA (uracil1498-N3)-methyltransferase
VENTGLKRFFFPFSGKIETFPHTLRLEDKDLINYLGNVLRLKPGKQILLIDGQRQQGYKATLEEIRPQHTTLTLTQTIEGSPHPSSMPKVHLAVSLIKEQRWDWLLQKTTELGVYSLYPLQTERTVIDIHDPPKKLTRWKTILQSAAEQSEGWFIPEISPPSPLGDFFLQTSHISSKIFLLERDSETYVRPSLKEYLNQQHSSEIVVAIGPEGGWSFEETEIFLSHGFQAVSLGDRILRTETAAIALMSALTYAYDSIL